MSKSATKKVSKAERQAAIGTTKVDPQVEIDRLEALGIKSGDQNDVPSTSGNQKSATKSVAVAPADGEAKTPKKPRKESSTVVAWKAKDKVPLEAKITLLTKTNIKRGAAHDRFELYTDGMTVGEYIEKSFKAKNSKALAMADVRWDIVKGFISVK